MQYDTPHSEKTQSVKAPPAWLARKLATLRSRARAGRIVLRFGDPLIPAAFTLLTSGQATVVTDHARKMHILALTGEANQ